jgi:hypothetical protein
MKVLSMEPALEEVPKVAYTDVCIQQMKNNHHTPTEIAVSVSYP